MLLEPAAPVLNDILASSDLDVDELAEILDGHPKHSPSGSDGGDERSMYRRPNFFG